MGKRRSGVLPFAHRTVAAPMVGCSDLAFRLLCRRHGADLVYTEMLYAERVISDPEYRTKYLFSQLDPSDRPLVAQLCGREASELVAAAKLLEPHVDAIDINLGCPQQRAKDGQSCARFSSSTHFSTSDVAPQMSPLALCAGGYGAYLLDEEHWPRVFGCVSSLATALSLPISCKIRLCATLSQTLRFARGLEASGCALLCVHGRHRGTPSRRRSGPADLGAVRLIKAPLPPPDPLTPLTHPLTPPPPYPPPPIY